VKIEKLNARQPIAVAILGFDGVSALDLTGPLETFAAARVDDGETGAITSVSSQIDWRNRQELYFGIGTLYKTRYTLRNAVLVDTVIIPGGAAVQMGEVSRKIAEWLSNRAVSIRRIASVCGGIYAVAKRVYLRRARSQPTGSWSKTFGGSFREWMSIRSLHLLRTANSIHAAAEPLQSK